MEANTLFVVHRAKDADEISQAVAEAVGELGTAISLMPGVWHVQSDRNGAQAFSEIRAAMTTADQLLVVDMSNNAFLSWPDSGAYPPPSS